MSKIGILSVSSNGLDNTFVEGKQAPGPIFFLPEIWNVPGDISFLKDRLNLIIATIDRLISDNKPVDLVVFPEMGASLGQYPIELKKEKSGYYEITCKNPLSDILLNFIGQLAKRKIGCIIQTMIREQGLIPKYPKYWTYFNSAGIFVDYNGQIYDIHKKSIITGIVRIPDHTGPYDTGKLITDLYPEYRWIDDTKPNYEIPIYKYEEKIPALYLVCVETGSDEIINKAIASAPVNGYKLLFLSVYGSYQNEKACIANIIDGIQNRTYKYIRKLTEWDDIPNPYDMDLASYLTKFSNVMNQEGYVYQAAVSLHSNNPNCVIGEINVNFEPLKSYLYPTENIFWGLATL